MDSFFFCRVQARHVSLCEQVCVGVSVCRCVGVSQSVSAFQCVSVSRCVSVSGSMSVCPCAPAASMPAQRREVGGGGKGGRSCPASAAPAAAASMPAQRREVGGGGTGGGGWCVFCASVCQGVSCASRCGKVSVLCRVVGVCQGFRCVSVCTCVCCGVLVRVDVPTFVCVSVILQLRPNQSTSIACPMYRELCHPCQ